MKYLLMASLLLLGGASMSVNAAGMTQGAMENIVASRVDVISQKRGYLVFRYKKIRMLLISDVKHDRMRIIAPITEYPALTTKIKDAAMESNFHLALDARYGVSKGVLYSAYIHPMSPLTKQQVVNALDQVSNLARTFGSTYSSGSLTFGGRSQKLKSKQRQKAVGI